MTTYECSVCEAKHTNEFSLTCRDCDSEREEGDLEVCPVCCGGAYPLGSLGRLEHYRCRHCGWTFSIGE